MLLSRRENSSPLPRRIVALRVVGAGRSRANCRDGTGRSGSKRFCELTEKYSVSPHDPEISAHRWEPSCMATKHEYKP